MHNTSGPGQCDSDDTNRGKVSRNGVRLKQEAENAGSEDGRQVDFRQREQDTCQRWRKPDVGRRKVKLDSDISCRHGELKKGGQRSDHEQVGP